MLIVLFSNRQKIQRHFYRAHACFIKYFLMTKKWQQIKKLAYVTTCGPSGCSMQYAINPLFDLNCLSQHFSTASPCKLCASRSYAISNRYIAISATLYIRAPLATPPLGTKSCEGSAPKARRTGAGHMTQNAVLARVRNRSS